MMTVRAIASPFTLIRITTSFQLMFLSIDFVYSPHCRLLLNAQSQLLIEPRRLESVQRSRRTGTDYITLDWQRLLNTAFDFFCPPGCRGSFGTSRALTPIPFLFLRLLTCERLTGIIVRILAKDVAARNFRRDAVWQACAGNLFQAT
jgi:hypothetical protein